MRIHCVTLNPAVDITYKVPSLDIHETNRVASVMHRPGGKGVNVARILADQTALEVSVYGFLGGHDGDELSEQLQWLSPSITQTWTWVDQPTRKTIAVVDPAGTTMLNERGCEVDQKDWERLGSQLCESTSEDDWVVISGSMPRNTEKGRLAALIKALEPAGVNVVVDTSGDWLLEAAQAKPKLVKPNQSELIESTGISDLEKAVDYLHTLGAEVVVVSMGADGALYSSQESTIRGALSRSINGNPTGAGDAMVAGMVAELSCGPQATAEKILETGICWSAAAVLSDVAGESKSEDRNALRKLVKLEESNAS